MAPPRLLFVDDESGIRLTLSAILHQSGFDVTVAASVPEALALIGKNRYEVLLSDLNIGEPGDGFTVVSAMRRSQPHAATFILTGYPDFESALLAIRNQVDDYFTKPADVKTLVSTITKRLTREIGSPEAVPLRRVSEILREHSESICDEWLRVVGENGDLSRVQLTTEERKDHVPAVLQELIGRVERDSADTSQQAVSAAKSTAGFVSDRVIRLLKLCSKLGYYSAPSPQMCKPACLESISALLSPISLRSAKVSHPC